MTDPRPIGNRDVLRIPAFRTLFLAQAISDLGDAITNLALLLVVNALTHSPAALAALAITIAVPSMVGSVVAGGIADRVDRRRVMIGSDVARAVLVLGFIVAAAPDRLPLLYAIAFIQAAIGTLFTPARGALIPRTVPREGLLAANGVGQNARIIMSVAGATLIGTVWSATGAAWPGFAIDASTFLASAALVLTVPAAIGAVPVLAAAGGGLGASVGAGLRLIGHSPTLIATLVGATVATLGLGAINVLFLPFLVNVLHESPAWSGPAEGAQTLSMIAAAVLIPALGGRVTAPALQVIGLGGLGIMCAALAITPNAPVLLVVLFVLGWFLAPAQIATRTLIQTSVDDAARGRVIGAVQAATSTASIVSMAAAGILANVIGVPAVLLGGGLVCVLGAAAAAALFAADRARQASVIEPKGEAA